jgi:hypothetical protein
VKTMPGASFRSSLSGAYAMAFKRKDEGPLVDLAFFDGDRSLEELRELIRIATEALRAAERMAP